MTTNDVLKRLRFAVKLNDSTMVALLESAGFHVVKETLASYFLKDEEPGFSECPREALGALLDGLITMYRGKREAGQEANVQKRAALDNNMILKKIRIALSLREEDLIAIMRLGGADVSRNELSALFRDRKHKNYKECMDQFLRNFLSGLGKYLSTHPAHASGAQPAGQATGSDAQTSDFGVSSTAAPQARRRPSMKSRVASCSVLPRPETVMGAPNSIITGLSRWTGPKPRNNGELPQ